MLTRRNMLFRTAIIAAASQVVPLNKLFAAGNSGKFHISACDWSIGMNSNIKAFEVAKQIGLEGIQVNMGSEKNNMHLRDRSLQQSYLETSRNTGIKISSLAIGELNNVPYKSDPRTEEWVWDSVEVAKNLGVSVILLAFFDNNDLRNDEPGKKEVIRRLKKVAPRAEKMGIILGIESYLNAAEHLEIIESVGSPSVKAYIDFRNTADAGYDVVKEVKQLGRNNICELHMKENGFLLGKGTLPWERIRDLIYEIGYYGDGWMQIEGGMPAKADIIQSYKQNHQYLKTLFSREITTRK
ncbi:MAG TPA: sugar phosphate isomerase/epimerase family protein [Chryseolinea sp.]|nr:sugar phosphate isomerase/epimerase family protein [Chryseolinea sp.]